MPPRPPHRVGPGSARRRFPAGRAGASASARRLHLIVMVKEPRPGRVKTRLAKDIGSVDAVWWFRHQTRSLLRRLDDPRWRIVLAVAPDREGLSSRVWPPGIPKLPQGSGDLGARMARLLTRLRPCPALLVGSDVPDLQASHIARAMRLLDRNDAVFGPSPDGGYWLVGLRNLRPAPPGLFKGVRWSSEHALSDTLATLPGQRVGFANALSDVDTVGDLRRARALISDGVKLRQA